MEKLDQFYGLFIDGAFCESSDKARFKTYSPATGEVLAEVAEATREDVDRAVSCAWKAFASWKKLDKVSRSKILLDIADIIDANKEHLARVESMDNGKPVRETLAVDVPLAADHFRYFAGAIRTEEDSATFFDENTLSLIIHEPIGVVGQIVPWNFPFLMAAWKLAPVLASGCCSVLKTSSSTPLSVLELMKLIKDIVPKGVINVISGSGSKSGQYMLEHKGFRKLAFTGSTEVGYSVAKAAADRLIPATLELGGKSANIVFRIVISIWQLTDCSSESSLTRVRYAVRVPVYLSMRIFTTNLWKRQWSSLTRLRSEIRWKRTRRWEHRLMQSRYRRFSPV